MSTFKTSVLYLKHNPDNPMPNFCVPLRALQDNFEKGDSPFHRQLYAKCCELEKFFEAHDKYPLSMPMRNVLIGEFVRPLIDTIINYDTAKVDSLVEAKKFKIEIEKVKKELNRANTKIKSLEEEIQKERISSRKFLDNGIALKGTIEEFERVYEGKARDLDNQHCQRLSVFEDLEKQRKADFGLFCDKVDEVRNNEYTAVKGTLSSYNDRLGEQWKVIEKVSAEVTNVKVVVKSLEK
ncbi:hypothetical protein JTE90_016097 [Oedothorax gibbosus]|uniref:Uncharacterized protein n=1 Tax=Oedothorax gibbosus TaxID=931172 RepID=A0AAV6TRZ9_9ARAC|nr:hypothetical protein JTE90_016097 [Oedothorax gibbosus]